MTRVEDGLPPDGAEVLVLNNDYGEWDVAQYFPDVGDWYSTVSGEPAYTVTHWSELPARPE